MDLKEIVTTAITGLAEAIKDADERIKPLGALVDPGTHKEVGAVGSDAYDDVHARTRPDFDIAISAASSNEGSGGAKARIEVIEASVGEKGEETSGSVSRLSFSIDVVLPGAKDQKTRIGLVQTSVGG